MEPADALTGEPERICVPVIIQAAAGGAPEDAVLITHWPMDVKYRLDGSNKYMKALLECSPYPLCLFNFNGQLITCNPAAVAVFGKTIWLQSDIFGMSQGERRGLDPARGTSEDRSERCTAYESMMEALVEEGSSYQTDLLIRRSEAGASGDAKFWYCRVFAQRHKDPLTGEPLIMISHQDVTELRKVEGELGRMQMSANTKLDLMKHDSDVAGSLMVLLGEDWNFIRDQSGGHFEDDDDGSISPRSEQSTTSADSANRAERTTTQLHGLRACLDKADEWEFNVFELEREADGLPLQVLSWHLFTKHKIIEDFNLDQLKFINFIRAIENGHQDNPYHNATHVADVLQSMHCLLTRGGISKFVTRFEKFAGLFAAIIHDFEHRGFNNDFLIKTVDDWAIGVFVCLRLNVALCISSRVLWHVARCRCALWFRLRCRVRILRLPSLHVYARWCSHLPNHYTDANDKSPNEAHHLSAAFRILRQPECNFLHRMPADQSAKFRKMVIEMVMATDMGEHMAIVSKLKNEIQKRLESLDDEIGDDPPEQLRILVMQSAIKVADIGHLFAELPVHIQWSEKLEEEMWRQGDTEKELSMNVSFLMDRDKPGVTKSQPGFIDFVVMPLFETWTSCFPESRVLLERIMANRAYWQSKAVEDGATQEK